MTDPDGFSVSPEASQIKKIAAQAPVMNDCRITPSAHPTYETHETTAPRLAMTVGFLSSVS
ncbi:MAG: hypothetical protein LBB55_02190 [Zoogloeaceae bacterium]|jgi:hypothetical protein|nr:hypothetical protein [Zoogloeaceae bacterium]